MGDLNTFAYSSVRELSEQIKTKKLSPVELLESVITRIEARNNSINAFIHLDYEAARESAKQAEQAVMDGKKLGILHGIPTAIKDLLVFNRVCHLLLEEFLHLRIIMLNFNVLFWKGVENLGTFFV